MSLLFGGEVEVAGGERLDARTYIMCKFGNTALQAFVYSKHLGKDTEIAFMWARYFSRNYHDDAGPIEVSFVPVNLEPGQPSN